MSVAAAHARYLRAQALESETELVVKIIRLVPNCPRPQTTDIGWLAKSPVAGLRSGMRTLRAQRRGLGRTTDAEFAHLNFGAARRQMLI